MAFWDRFRSKSGRDIADVSRLELPENLPPVEEAPPTELEENRELTRRGARLESRIEDLGGDPRLAESMDLDQLEDYTRRLELRKSQEEEAAYREGLKQERAEAEAEALRLGLEKTRAELEGKRTATARSRHELTKSRIKEASKVGKAITTLGGVPATQRPGGIKDLYFGRPRKKLWQTDDVKSLTMPGASRGMLIADTVLPVKRVGGEVKGLNLSFLREMMMPRGLSKIEQAAFAEIRANHDRDTLGHIGNKLGMLGFPRKEVEGAVKSLESKGLIGKVVEAKGEEPIYEVKGG